MRLVASHELVHALQDQYVRLDSIIHQHRRKRPALRGPGGARRTGDVLPDLDPDARAAAREPARGWFWRQREAIGPAAVADARILRCAALAAGDADLPVSGGRGLHRLVRPHPSQAGAVRRGDAASPPSRSSTPTATTPAMSRWRCRSTGPAVDTVRYEDDLGRIRDRLAVQPAAAGLDRRAESPSRRRDGGATATVSTAATPMPWCGTRCGMTPPRAIGSRAPSRPPGRRAEPGTRVAATGSIRSPSTAVPGPALWMLRTSWAGWKALPGARIAK